jgi:uncharacterized membrane protein YfcA
MSLTVLSAIALFGASLLGGAMNAIAGGASFITFPTLLALGLPPIPANATNTVGIWPATLAGAGALREELAVHGKRLRAAGAVSLAGGVVGAVLLLHTPSVTFVKLLPWLMLVATLLFAFGKRLTAALRRSEAHAGLGGPFLVVQLAIAVYGGFYGGGMGMMMLAGLALAGLEDVHEMNALKNALSTLINGVAVATFAVAGVVSWPHAGIMAVGATLGGYVAARYSRRVDPRWVRAFVIASGAVLTVFFFLKS